MKKLFYGLLCILVFLGGCNNQQYENYIVQGVELDTQGDYQGALNNFNKAIELKPNKFEGYGARGSLYIKEQLEPQKGLNDLKKAIELGYEDPMVYIGIGYANMQLRNYQDALDAYDYVIKDGSADKVSLASAYTTKALILIKQYGKKDEAIININEALKLAPTHPDIINAQSVINNLL